MTDPAASAAGDVDSDIDQIERLGELRDQGLISDDEFEAKKRDILGPLTGGRYRRLAARVDARWRAGLTWADAIRQAVPAVDLLWEGASRFRRNNGSVLIGFITYRMFLWLVPLTLVLTALLGYSSAVETFDVLGYASDYGIDEQTSQDLADQAESGRLVLLLSGMIGLLWTTRGLIRGLHYSFAQASGMEIRSRRGAAREALFAVPGTVVLTMLVLVIGVLQRQGPVLTLAAWAASLVTMGVVLWFICRAMPHRPQHWYQLLPGPIVAATGLSLVQLFLTLYLPQRIESSSALYGSMGLAVSMLFSIFLVASLLVVMPFANDLWFDRRAILDGRPWILDPNALPSWARRPAGWIVRRQDRPDHLEAD